TPFSYPHPLPAAPSPLSLHDALPISPLVLDREADPGRERHMTPDDPVAAHEPPAGVEQVHRAALARRAPRRQPAVHGRPRDRRRSEEHTSELQSRGHLVCRLLLEKKK